MMMRHRWLWSLKSIKGNNKIKRIMGMVADQSLLTFCLVIGKLRGCGGVKR